MERVILYSNGCPKCRVLEAKLNAKNIAFEKSEDFSKLMQQGKQSLPFLEVEGQLLDFPQGNAWVNNYVERECKCHETSENSAEMIDGNSVKLA